MIPFEDYIEHAPTEVGEQVAIDHVNCPAGTDMRGRLYIKRASEELVLAYCHNCADKGYYVCGYSNVASYRNKEGKAAPEIKSIKFPDGLVQTLASWPWEAISWAQKYLTHPDIRDMGLFYWPRQRRVLIPFGSRENPGVCGYQTRKVFPDDPLPKYLSYLYFELDPKRSRFYIPYYSGGVVAPTKDTIVICEDMISAYKLYVAGYDPYCLCGGHFDINEFYRDQQRLLPDTKKITVWLDNDNREIRQLAKRTRELLSLTYPLLTARGNVTWVREAKEPKQCTDLTEMVLEPNE
jgi:hypothetical protein